MAYRDKNIEDLKARYSAYLESLDSADIGAIAEDVELLIIPADELSPLLDLLHARRKNPPEEYEDSADYTAGLEYAIEIIEAIL